MSKLLMSSIAVVAALALASSGAMAASYYVDGGTASTPYTVTYSDGTSHTLMSQSYEYLYIGHSSSYNNLVVSNATTITDVHRFFMSDVSGYSNNTLLLSGGSIMSSSGNNFTVSSGNSITIDSQSILTFGASDSQNYGFFAFGGTILCSNGGVFAVANTSTSRTLNYNDTGVFELNKGVVAMKGDRTSSNSLNFSYLQVWNGSSYVTGTKDTDETLIAGEYQVVYCATADEVKAVLGSYCTDTEASSLAGYTLITDIPEPTTMALLAIGGIGVLVRRRRK